MLLTAKGRRERGRFLVEGRTNVAAALAAGWVEALYLTDSAADLAGSGERVYWVSEPGLKAIAETVTPQGVVAVCRQPATDWRLWLPSAERVVVCAGVSDPGNLGTIIRTAAAFGYDGVVATAGSADVWSGKVVRSTAGTFAKLQIAGSVPDRDLIAALSAQGAQVLVTAGAAASRLAEVESQLRRPHVWVFGSEAHGVPDEWLSAGRPVRIEMAAGVESLNVAAAASICLYSGRVPSAS